MNARQNPLDDPEVRIVGVRPAGADGSPPEIRDGIYYIGRHRGRHVLNVYPYVHDEGTPFDVDAWDQSRQKVVIPAPLTRRAWKIGYAVARKVLCLGQAYYRDLSIARDELNNAIEGGKDHAPAN
ncbi:MAG: hypothetical protein PHU46_12035 [Rhodocyclaceae bacterium]|nr:hypothetical protein [Rhodocyclaceae bacterium]